MPTYSIPSSRNWRTAHLSGTNSSRKCHSRSRHNFSTLENRNNTSLNPRQCGRENPKYSIRDNSRHGSTTPNNTCTSRCECRPRDRWIGIVGPNTTNGTLISTPRVTVQPSIPFVSVESFDSGGICACTESGLTSASTVCIG